MLLDIEKLGISILLQSLHYMLSIIFLRTENRSWLGIDADISSYNTIEHNS